MRSLSLIEKEKQTAAAVSKLSKDQLRNEIERFKLGKSTSYQISQYQQDVVEAEQQEILIRIRQEKIGVDLLVLTGEFKEKYELSQEWWLFINIMNPILFGTVKTFKEKNFLVCEYGFQFKTEIRSYYV